MSGFDPTAGKLELTPASVTVTGNIKQVLFNSLVAAGGAIFIQGNDADWSYVDDFVQVAVNGTEINECFIAKINTLNGRVSSFYLASRNLDDETLLIRVDVDREDMQPVQAVVLTDWEIDLDDDMYHIGSKFRELAVVQPA